MTYLDTAPEFDTESGRRDGAFPRFYVDKAPDKARSDADGVPRFRDVEMVEITVPGDRLNIVHRIVNDEIRKRWPRAYEAFRQDREAPTDGTPIEQLPGMTASRTEELRYFHVRTIEQLAGMPDDLLKKAAPMDGFALREKAARWVEAANGNAAEERLAAENRKLRDNMQTMEQTMAAMRQQMETLQAQMDAKAGGAPEKGSKGGEL